MLKNLRSWSLLLLMVLASGISSAQVIYEIGTGTVTNSSTSYPAPYGNYYWGSADQYIIRASELSSVGATPGMIQSLAFDVSAVNPYVGANSTALTNFTIKIGHTTLTEFPATAPTSGVTGLTQVFTVASYQEVLGWNTHTFTTPFQWDGVSNIIIEICHNNTTYTNNASVNQSTTSFVSSYNYRSDGNGNCSYATDNAFGPVLAVANQRPNMRIGILPPSGRDARLGSLVSPVNLIIGNNQVTARVVNVAADPIANFNLSYQLNNNPPVSVTAVSPPTPLAAGQTFDYSFSTPLNITTPGAYTIKTWLSNANGLGADNNTSNDTLVSNICTGLFGTYTIGATGNYTTIAAAVSDLTNCGISAPVTFQIQPGVYYGSYVLQNILGAAAPNSITFTSATSNAADVILVHDTATAATNKSIFNLTNTPNVTFSLLTFRRTLNAPAGSFYQIRFGGESNFGTVVSCVFDDQTPLSSTSSGNYGIFADNSDNLNISGNSFNGFYYTIYLTGPTANNGYESFNQVLNNTLTNYRYGIYGVNQSMMNVNSNTVSTAASTFGYGIYLSRVIGFNISQNVVSGTIGNAGIYVFNANDSTGLENLIVNNAVSGQSFIHTSAFTSLYGIYVSGSFSATATAPVNPLDRVSVLHNSVNIGANVLAGATTTMAPLFMTGGSNTTPAWNGATIMNNMMVAYQPTGANAASGMRGLYFSNDTLKNVTVSNYNNFYLYDESNGTALTNALVQVDATDYLTLADWTTASTRDANSVSRNPGFSSPILAIPTAFLSNDLGTPIPAVSTDILGTTRSATAPDMGAYEFTPSPFDLGITAVISNSACADSNHSIRVTLKNVGFQTYNFAANNSTISVNIAGPIAQAFTLNITSDSLRVDSSRTYLVSSAVNFITPGTYTLTADLVAPTDGNLLNNGGTRTVSFVTPTAVPYTQNFNSLTSLPAGFVSNMGFNTVTGLDQTAGLRYNVYGVNASSVTLPFFGPIPSSGYIFEFAYKMTEWSGWSWPGTPLPLGVGDTIKVQVSTDCGVSFQTVSAITDQNYVASDQFTYFRINLNAYTGDEIYLRVVFEQTSGLDVYFDLDNFRVFLPPPVDLSVNRVLGPTEGCGLTNDTVTVRLINNGTAAQSAFPLIYTLNGGTPVSETFAGPINPGDTIIYNFNTLVNVSTIGVYNIVAYHGRAGDGDFSNDTARTTFNNIPIVSSFPYTESWENGAGGWIAGGTASSWALGIPTTSGGASPAYSDSNAWVTNLTGDYNSNEQSHITSPCFDLSALSNVRVRFGIWYETEEGWDGVTLQYTTDGGNTWSVAGAVGAGVNWYSAASVGASNGLPVWANTNGSGSGGWLPAELTIPALANQASVRFRFLFGSDGSGENEGIGIDSFRVDLPTDPIIQTVTTATDSCINATREITANITQFRSLTTVNLHHDLVGSGTFTAIPMTRVGISSNWTATIPVSSPAVRNRYFVTVVDSIGLTDTSGTISYKDNYLGLTVFPLNRTALIGDTVVLRAFATGIANVKITEVVQYRTGTGQTPTYPAHVSGEDLVEISNLGSSPADLTGFTFDMVGAGARNYTFPAGAIVPGNGTLVLHLGTGTDDPANAYFNTGGTTDGISSGSATGYIMKDAAGTIVDALATNGYTFDVASGVTAADWSGNLASSSGLAGVIRTNSDNNDAADWVLSSATSLMSVGSLNTGMTMSTSAGSIVWNTIPPTNGDTLVAGPFTSNGTFTYTATLSDGRCNVSVTATVVVGASPPDIGVSLIAAPASGSTINTNSPIDVTARIKNYGGVAASGFDVEYRVNGGLSIVTNSITQTIAPGDSLMHTFTLAWTPPATGATFSICANTTGLPNEVNRANDTACATIVSTVGVDELAISNRLIGKVYPNPAESFVNFEFNEFQGKGTLEIHDKLGRVVATVAVDRANGPVQSVRTETWAAGMYSYRFIASDQVQHGNLVVKK